LKKKIFFSLILSSLGFCSAGQSNLPSIQKLGYLIDTANSINFEQLYAPKLAEHFKDASANKPILGNNQTFWLRFTLHNPTGNELWLLEFDKWVYVDLYMQTSAGTLHKKTGHFIPYRQRDFPLANRNLIALSLPPGQSVMCYVRIESSNRFMEMPNTLNFLVHEKVSYLYNESMFRYFHGILVGALCIMILYNLFIWFSVREKSYWFYILLLVNTAYSFEHNAGYTLQLLSFWDSQVLYFSEIDIINGSIGCSFFLLLSQAFLNTKQTMPFWNAVIQILNVGFYLIVPLLFALDTYQVYRLQAFYVFPVIVSVILFSSISYYKKLPSANYFLLANLSLIVGTFIFVLKELTIIPLNPATHFAFNIGVVLQVGFFSLAFANRINLLRRDNEQKQNEIISQLQEKEKYLLAWQASQLNLEKLQKENLTFQFESLKNQVNPHFLFNSLNVLSELVYTNQNHAMQFVHRMADVYRYILDNKNKKIVPLQTEMAFIEDFIFLLKIRFDSSLRFIDLVQTDLPIFVAPFSLQLLIENAVKHNIISEEDPLTIRIMLEDKYIVVNNNKQLKRTPVYSNGIGLQNLCKRYRYLTPQDVVISDEAHRFLVKIPILRLGQHEITID
jgi:sensor histidine kinase YesM